MFEAKNYRRIAQNGEGPQGAHCCVVCILQWCVHFPGPSVSLKHPSAHLAVMLCFSTEQNEQSARCGLSLTTGVGCGVL